MQFNKVHVVVKSVTYNATWHEDDGKVYLSSAYGSATAKAGTDPGTVAQKLFAKILKDRKR